MDTAVISTTNKISLPWKWRPLKRRMLPGCELFVEGDTALQSARKLIPLEDNSRICETDIHTEKKIIPCGVVGCIQTFTSLLSYENHYNSVHRHTCITCHRTFPSSYLLDIHIQENHDPLFAILAARQNMYQCLVESCCKKFSTPGDRRQHLIKIHRYPSNFRFHRLHPADSQQRKKQQSPATANTMEIDSSSQACAQMEQSQTDSGPLSQSSLPAVCVTESGSNSDKENVALTETSRQSNDKDEGTASGMDVSAAPRRVFVHKVPHNFTFGHGVSRGFQRPPNKRGKKKGAHWHQRACPNAGETTTNIETVDMKDMADALTDAV